MQWEVVIDKPMNVKEPDVWDGGWKTVTYPRTIAIVYAASEDRLLEKLRSLYPSNKVLSYRRMKS